VSGVRRITEQNQQDRYPTVGCRNSALMRRTALCLRVIPGPGRAALRSWLGTIIASYTVIGSQRGAACVLMPLGRER